MVPVRFSIKQNLDIATVAPSVSSFPQKPVKSFKDFDGYPFGLDATIFSWYFQSGF
jgi:hypothetical protein